MGSVVGLAGLVEPTGTGAAVVVDRLVGVVDGAPGLPNLRGAGEAVEVFALLPGQLRDLLLDCHDEESPNGWDGLGAAGLALGFGETNPSAERSTHCFGAHAGYGGRPLKRSPHRKRFMVEIEDASEADGASGNLEADSAAVAGKAGDESQRCDRDGRIEVTERREMFPGGIHDLATPLPT